MTLGADNDLHLVGIYLTPLRQGSVSMASIDIPRVYLVRSDDEPPEAEITPIPNVVFVFDLSTRQWVNP
jgi:hypothetical protein